ncbi:hypothetical protein ARMSODRAFT_560383 [Armillaria solidipes]|uniref:Uncharacterized protein n=1 Tax=Armillaria solidipes TaxID=1076256 RepID=A0A2H3AVM2_9AGAR|nr:hypothetical protein ARMSODRAFT_560383 [Armillaria solidipes]
MTTSELQICIAQVASLRYGENKVWPIQNLAYHMEGRSGASQPMTEMLGMICSMKAVWACTTGGHVPRKAFRQPQDTTCASFYPLSSSPSHLFQAHMQGRLDHIQSPPPSCKDHGRT